MLNTCFWTFWLWNNWQTLFECIYTITKHYDRCLTLLPKGPLSLSSTQIDTGASQSEGNQYWGKCEGSEGVINVNVGCSSLSCSSYFVKADINWITAVYVWAIMYYVSKLLFQGNKGCLFVNLFSNSSERGELIETKFPSLCR